MPPTGMRPSGWRSWTLLLTRVSLYRTIFPQMTLWLPEDEAAQLRFEFEAEMARPETV
jgi:hypothetical protein